MNKAQAFYESIGNEIFMPLINKLEGVDVKTLPDKSIVVTFDDNSAVILKDGFASVEAESEDVDYRNKFVVAVGSYTDVGRPDSGPNVKVSWEQVDVFANLDAAMDHMTVSNGPVVELCYVDHDNVVWTINLRQRS